MMGDNNFTDLNPRKLLSLEGKKWSQLNFGVYEDSSSNDIEDGKSDISSGSPTTNGISFNNIGVSDTMKLKEEDMYLFGVCPAYDPFYLAVCEYCGQVIKPQALAKHIELRHRRAFPQDSNHISEAINSRDHSQDSTHTHSSSISSVNTKLISNKSSNDENNRSESNSIGSVVGKLSLTGSDKNRRSILLDPIPPGPGPGSSSSLGLTNNINSNNNQQTKSASSIIPGHSSTCSPFNNISTPGSSSSNSSPNSSNSSLTIGSGTSSNSRHTSQSTGSVKHDGIKRNSQNNVSHGKSAHSSLVKKAASIRGKLLPCKDREYDPDKHCGVKTPDMDKPCTRSLTCKTHSLTLRRSVNERSKNFDELLAEHRANKEAALRAAGIEIKPTKQQIKQRELEAKRQLLSQQQQKQQLKQQQQQKLQLEAEQQQKQHHQQQQHQHHHQKLLQQQQLDQQQHLQQPHKELDVALPSSQNVMIGKSEKFSPILARQLNEGLPDIKPETSSTATTIEKPTFIEVDGSLYLPNHPKPMALCSFNARQISLAPLNCDQDDSNQCNLSSRLFTRKRDLTYTALSIFREKSNSKINTNNRPRNQNLLSIMNLN